MPVGRTSPSISDARPETREPASTTEGINDFRWRSQPTGSTNHEKAAEELLVERVAAALLRLTMALFVRLLRIRTAVVVEKLYSMALA